MLVALRCRLFRVTDTTRAEIPKATVQPQRRRGVCMGFSGARPLFIPPAFISHEKEGVFVGVDKVSTVGGVNCGLKTLPVWKGGTAV